MRLSVVIVARNEEKNIGRCIESILRCTAEIPGTEVLLSDSASTDHTIEIAARYPINIISLKPEWPRSPSAGRFCGVNNVSGDYVMIVDGDMELCDGWVAPALEFLDKNPRVASVVGKIKDIWLSGQEVLGEISSGEKGQKVDYIFGSSIFRRKELVEVGNFQPFLRAEEEAEISDRLIRAGHELYFLPILAVNHFRTVQSEMEEIQRRSRNKLWAGMGDMFSWCFYRGAWRILWLRFPTVFLAVAAVFLELAVVGIMIGTGRFEYFALAVSLPVLVFLLLSVKKKGFAKGWLSMTTIGHMAWSVFLGAFRTIRPASEYPRDVVWVKRTHSQGGIAR